MAMHFPLFKRGIEGDFLRMGFTGERKSPSVPHGTTSSIDTLVGWAKRSVPTIGVRVGTLRFAHPTVLKVVPWPSAPLLQSGKCLAAILPEKHIVYFN